MHAIRRLSKNQTKSMGIAFLWWILRNIVKLVLDFTLALQQVMLLLYRTNMVNEYC